MDGKYIILKRTSNLSYVMNLTQECMFPYILCKPLHLCVLSVVCNELGTSVGNYIYDG